MDEYRWKARTRQGQICHGTLVAQDSREAGFLLKQNYAYILQLRKLSPLEKPISFSHSLSLSEKTEFFRQLGLLLEGDIPILKALHMVSLGRNPRVCQLSRELEQDLQNGFALSQALARHGRELDPMGASLVAAGEKSGRTVYILKRLAEFYDQQRQLAKSLQQACLYPCIVLLLALGIGGYFVGSVLPVLMDMFQSLRVRPSAALQVLMTLRNVAATNPGLALSLIPMSLWSLLLAGRHKGVLLQHLPLVRGAYREFWEIRYCQLLSLLLSGGMLLDQALPAANRILPDRALRRAGRSLAQAILAVRSLGQGARENPRLFSPMTCEFIAIGEESGTLADMLAEGTAIKERAFKDKLERAKKLLEPALLLGLAMGSGALMYLVLSPMQELMSGMALP